VQHLNKDNILTAVKTQTNKFSSASETLQIALQIMDYYNYNYYYTPSVIRCDTNRKTCSIIWKKLFLQNLSIL